MDDLWGDDNDDDLILVASQIEEVYSQQQVASQMNISQMNCSYGGFARKADVFSTQNSKPVAVQKFSYNVRKQMDDENDLDVIALMNDLENNVDKPGPSAMRPLQPSVQDRKHHLESNSQKENSKDAQIKHITK